MWKLTLQDINTTPKEPKTERGRSRRQLFRPFRGSSVERLCCKIPAQERLRGRLAPCMAMIVQKLRPQTPDFPAENTWGVEFLGGTHFRDTLGSKFPDQFSLRQRTSDLFEKRSGYERSHDHFKPASRVCLFWVSSFEKYVTVFSWILVYWCYGFWHRLPEEIIILVIFDNSVFFFSFFLEESGFSAWKGCTCAFDDWSWHFGAKKRSRKDFCSCAWVSRGGFQRRGMQSLF